MTTPPTVLAIRSAVTDLTGDHNDGDRPFTNPSPRINNDNNSNHKLL